MNAYTVKKMVPRLIMAVIGVNLSWYVCVALIDIVNALGSSIEAIMLEPFNNSGLSVDVVSALSGGQVAALGASGALIITGTLLFSSFAILGPTLLGGLIALLVGYISLVVRQMLIVMLTILAPLIIALWVIPGTSKSAEKGISLYIKLLLMYPIIIALLTSGRIFAAISNSVDGLLPRVIAMVALFAPYFMIPLVLKFVGGAIASIVGMISNRTQGMLDLQRKSAHRKAEANRAATLGGRRWDDNKLRGAGKYMNAIGAYAGRPGMLLAKPTGGRIGGKAYGEYTRGMEKDRMEALEHLKSTGILDHDAGNEMASHWQTDKSARERIKHLSRSDAEGGSAKQREMAGRLRRVQDLTGERYVLAAADMSNGFGKLDDRSIRSINDMYDDIKYDSAGNEVSRSTSELGRMRKKQAFGRLKEQGKGSGNFTTFAMDFDDATGQILTYTDANGNVNQKVADNLAVALQDAGPGILGQTKQYEVVDDDLNKVSDTKTAHINALARMASGSADVIDRTAYYDPNGKRQGTLGQLKQSAAEAGDPSEKARLEQEYKTEFERRHRRAMEQFVITSQSGGYNDTNTKVAADRAKAAHIDSSPENQALYAAVQNDMLMRGRVGGLDENNMPQQIGLESIAGIPRATPGQGSRPPKPGGEDFS